MSIHNFRNEQRESFLHTVKTEAATLSKAELDGGSVIINDASGIAITLPVAATHYAGAYCLIANKGAGASTVTVAAGFGGAGSGTDTITLAQGDMASVLCDGNNWYSLHHTTGG